MNTIKTVLIMSLSLISIFCTVGCNSSIVESTNNSNVVETGIFKKFYNKSDILTHEMAYDIAYNKAMQIYHTDSIYSNGITSDNCYEFIINTDTYTMHAYVDMYKGSIAFDNPAILINNIGQDQAEKFAYNYLDNYYKSNYTLLIDHSRMTEVSDWKFIASNTIGESILLSVDCYGVVSEEEE